MAAVVPAAGSGRAVATAMTTPEQELRQRSHDDLVGLVRRLESDKLALMSEHSAVMREVNRRLQTHLVEIRALRDANVKVEDDARSQRAAREQVDAEAREAAERAATETRELRELCCFLDDERQRLRRLSHEWQRYGQHVTAAGLDRGLGELTARIAELEQRQGVVVDENSRLRELCLFLDDERTAAAAAMATPSMAAVREHVPSAAARNGGGGVGGGDATYGGSGAAAAADHGRGLGDGASSLTIAAAAPGTAAAAGAATTSGKDPLADDAAASYIRALEMRVQSLEQERNNFQKILEVHEQLERSTGAAAVAAAGLGSADRPDEQQLPLLQPAPSPGGTSDASDELGLTEKAIVRELCNVIWRKLEERKTAAPPAGPSIGTAAAADSRIGPQGSSPLGSRLGPQGSSTVDGDGVAALRDGVNGAPPVPTTLGPPAAHSDASDGRALPTSTPVAQQLRMSSSAFDGPTSAAAPSSWHGTARHTFGGAPFMVANGPVAPTPHQNVSPPYAAPPGGISYGAAGAAYEATFTAAAAAYETNTAGPHGPAYPGRPQQSRSSSADRYTSFVVTGSSLVNGDRASAAASQGRSSSSDRHAGPAAAGGPPAAVYGGPPAAVYGGPATAATAGGPPYSGESAATTAVFQGRRLPGSDEAAVGRYSTQPVHSGHVSHGGGGGSSSSSAAAASASSSGAAAASASRLGVQPLLHDVSSRSSSVSSTGSWSAPHSGIGGGGGSSSHGYRQPGAPPLQPTAFSGAVPSGHALFGGTGLPPSSADHRLLASELADGRQQQPPLLLPPHARPGPQQQQYYSNAGLPGAASAGSHISYPYAHRLP